jgi:hypothetical protein
MTVVCSALFTTTLQDEGSNTMPATDVETMTVQRSARLLDGGGHSSSILPSIVSDAVAEPWFGVLTAVSRMTQRIAERNLFSGMWLVIACVSSIDTYLTVRYRQDLYFLELNPIARFLLWVDGWEPSLLIGSKFLGSILVLGFVTALYSQNRRIGLIVTAALAGFQLLLLAFLTLV